MLSFLCKYAKTGRLEFEIEFNLSREDFLLKRPVFYPLLLLVLYVTQGYADQQTCGRFYQKENTALSATSEKFFSLDHNYSAQGMLPHIRRKIRDDLSQFNESMQRHLVIPKDLSSTITKGLHPLSAFAHPEQGHLIFDESLFSQPRIYQDGVVGHEMGHIIFQHSMIAHIKKQGHSIEDWRAMAEKFSDDSYLKREIEKLENVYPSLKKLTDTDPFDVFVPFNDVAVYQTLKSVLKFHSHHRKQMSAEASLHTFILHRMSGFHEVFGDFMGAVFSREASWAQYAFDVLGQRVLRDFRSTREQVMNPAVLQSIRTAAYNGEPHRILFMMRANIYEGFYRQEKTDIGNWDYDSFVGKLIIGSLGDSFNEAIETVPVYPAQGQTPADHLVEFLRRAEERQRIEIAKAKEINRDFFAAQRANRSNSTAPRHEQSDFKPAPAAQETLRMRQ